MVARVSSVLGARARSVRVSCAWFGQGTGSGRGWTSQSSVDIQLPLCSYRLSALITATTLKSPVLSAAHRHNQSRIGVIDIFAYPGGLGEGLSGFEARPSPSRHPFELAASAKMGVCSHATLRLRTFYGLLQRQQGETRFAY